MHEIKLVTSYAASPGDLAASLELINSGKVRVSDMVTHLFPLEEASEGFRLTAEANESLKAIIKPFDQWLGGNKTLAKKTLNEMEL